MSSFFVSWSRRPAPSCKSLEPDPSQRRASECQMTEDIHKVGQVKTRSGKKSADTVKVASFNNRGKGKERSARKELVAAAGKLQDRLSKTDWIKQGLVDQFNVPAADADKLIQSVDLAIGSAVREFRVSRLAIPGVKYEPRTDVIQFLRDNWNEWIEACALTMPLLQNSDLKAYNALNHYRKTNKLPDGWEILGQSDLTARDLNDPERIREARRIARLADRHGL